MNKEIHFPIVQAIHEPKNKMNWFKRTWKFLTYRRKFKIINDYALWVPFLDMYIFIPKDFITDHVSIPKVFNSFMNPSGVLLLGAYPHDFGYKYGGLILMDEHKNKTFQPFSKKDLDKIMKKLNNYENNYSTANKIGWTGLFIGGNGAWKKHRKINSSLQKDFPTLKIS